MSKMLFSHQDIHCETAVDALACWRLHLGSSGVLKRVCKAIQVDSHDLDYSFALVSAYKYLQAPGTLSRLYDSYMPVKNRVRKLRQEWLPLCEKCYSCANVAFYLAKPFLGAAFFYFDILKDVVLTVIIFQSTVDLTQEQFNAAEYPFETCIISALISSLILSQLIFAAISYCYCSEVFDMCDHARTKTVLFKAISVVFAPFMPAFILANHVAYLRLEYETVRELETLEDNKPEEEDYVSEINDKARLYCQIEQIR